MLTLDDVRNHIKASDRRHYALPMIDAIELRAETDVKYAAWLHVWLKGDGRTLILRDDLCAPFKEASFVKELEGTFRYPWHECWTALDTVRLQLRQKDNLL